MGKTENSAIEKPESAAPSAAESLTFAIEDSALGAWRKIQPHRWKILTAIIAIAAVVSGYALISHLQASAEVAAWDKIFMADFHARANREMKISDEFAKIAPEIAGTNARAYTYLLEMAKLGASDARDDWERAAAAGKNFIAQFPKHPLIAQAQVDYAALLANLGKYADAAPLYHQVANSPATELKNHARWFAALCDDRAGKVSEALDGYARVAADRANEYAELAAFARLRLEQRLNQTEKSAVQ